MASITVFAGGAVSGGKHLWKLSDDGSSISVIDSYTLAGDVTKLTISIPTNRLYIAIGNTVSCYDVSTMALITSWGTGGSINLGVSVFDIAVDSSDNLAVAHASITGFTTTLYNSSGSQVWRVGWMGGLPGSGDSVDFDIAGNVAVGCNNLTSGPEASLLNKATGAVLITYSSTTQSCMKIRASKSFANYVYYVISVSGSSFVYENGSPPTWVVGVAGASSSDILHLPNSSIVILADGSNLRKYDDLTGLNPASSAVGAAIVCLAGNADDEIYLSKTGTVCVYNTSLALQRSVSVSGAAINSIVIGSTSPTITDQSIDTSVNVGDAVSLFVTADGVPDPTYQWYKNDIAIAGETNSTLEFTSDENSGGTYKCVVTNVGGSDTSDPIVLSIYPEIIAQSGDTKSPLGTSITLFVTAIGYPANTYQWYKDGVVLAGRITASFSMYLTYDDSGSYHCVVSNAAGATTSGSILVTVLENPYRTNLFNVVSDLSREAG